MSLADRVVAAWYAPRLTPLSALLLPLSWLFRATVVLRRALYRLGIMPVQRVRAPVVIVGNLAVGGTGKTPLVGALAQALAARGFRPGIVSRGYGGSATGPREVRAVDDPAVVGDEPLIHAASGFPVWIGADRVAAARGLLAAHPECDVVIADDGLQHYRLARDVEIAVVDGARGAGNGQLMPAGPLREPRSRLREVDVVVESVAADLARTTPRNAGALAMTYVPGPWRNLKDPAHTADVATWRGREVHALAGIGSPARFFAMVAAQGIAAVEHPLPDHHAFAASDLAYPGAAAILMTQKDAVKCRDLADERCWYLPLTATLDPALVALVETKIRGSQTA
ncbi:MAG: tetraacyldisaccharide 4'-kinase [Burkholderiales bacterium]